MSVTGTRTVTQPASWRVLDWMWGAVDVVVLFGRTLLNPELINERAVRARSNNGNGRYSSNGTGGRALGSVSNLPGQVRGQAGG